MWTSEQLQDGDSLSNQQSYLRSTLTEPDSHYTLFLIGTPRIHFSGSEVQSIRGHRVRQILGLMVANALLHQKLSADEFRDIAADSIRDSEASANVTSVNITRIRKMLGAESLIVLTNKAPRLNPANIRVDVLEAAKLLGQCHKAIQDQNVEEATWAATEALQLVKGEEVYAELYGEFFEMARTDFEVMMRNEVLSVVKFLYRIGKLSDAITILQLAAESMPGDDEITTLFAETLVKTGHSVDAVRVLRKLHHE